MKLNYFSKEFYSFLMELMSLGFFSPQFTVTGVNRKNPPT